MTAPSFPSPPSANGGYVTNEVIWLQMKHLGDTIDVLRTHVVGELQMLRADSVRRDVYDEQRLRDRSEIEEMKKQIDRSEQRKWMMWVAVATAVLALGKDIFSSMII